MPVTPAKPRQPSAEADLAFMREIVEGGGRPSLTLAIAYLAGGLLYGLQCLAYVAQEVGLVRWSGPANLGITIFVTAAFLVVLVWAIRKDSRDGVTATRGPMASRALNAGFGGAGMANAAMIVIFGVGAARDHDMAIWFYYPAVVFGLQGAAWYMAYCLKRKPWMLATAIGGWLTAALLGVLVRQPTLYLYVCTVALFLLFAGPGWIMLRDARRRAAETL